MGASATSAPRLRVLCLSFYPDDGPSVRHRVMAYSELWRERGIELTHRAFLTHRLYRRRREFSAAARIYKALAMVFCACRAVLHLASAVRYDVVIVHREIFPLGPPWLERLVAALSSSLVYDFDDALWEPMPLAVNQRGRWWNPARFGDMMRSARIVVAGNPYLRDYATRFCDRIHIIPTPYLDLGGSAARAVPARPVIVWIGNVGNDEYLDILREPIRILARDYDFTLRIIGSAEGRDFSLDGVQVEFVEWTESEEARLLTTSTIGVMPLFDRPYERGKCAFKLIQYFSAGLPVVASPVGMNVDVVDEGVNGYLAADTSAWHRSLARLLADDALRRALGTNAYASYRARFTRETNAQLWCDVVEEAASGR